MVIMVLDGVSPKFKELLVVKLFKLAFITLLGTPVKFNPCCSIIENKLAPLEPDIFNLFNPLPNCSFVVLSSGSTLVVNFLFVFM